MKVVGIFGCLLFVSIISGYFVFQSTDRDLEPVVFPVLEADEIKTLVGHEPIPVTNVATTTQDNATQDEAIEEGEKKLETATFGNGCFWCTEAVFQRLKGVEKVVSGYTGGKVDNPTYKQVCSGRTGHAEAIQIQFDPEVISFAELLEVFWRTHDPTTLNRQGPDRGTQYRSAVFYHSDEQKKLAEKYKQKLDESKAFDDPIVTEITEASVFYPAEDYHQNYFNLNKRQPYCNAVIVPKIEKFQKVFKDKLKEDSQ